MTIPGRAAAPQPTARLLEGGEAGCLLLHGFSGSPLEMMPLAEALAGEGWTVAVAQLAGHGTTPRDLARATWQDWVTSARAAYDDLVARCRRVALVGLSMGGALALYLAAREAVAAVVTISAPIRVRPAMAAASRVVARVLPLAPVLVRLLPRDHSVRQYWSPYTRVPLGATGEVDRLLAAARDALPAVQAPLLVVQGRRDWIIPRRSASEIAALARSATVRIVWLPRSGHVATLDRDRAVLFSEIGSFLRSHLADSPGPPMR